MNLSSNATTSGYSWWATNSWVFAQIGTIVNMTFLLFCIFKLLRYGRRKGKWQLKWTDKQKVLMTLAVLTPVMIVVRTILTQAVIIIGHVAPVGPVGDFACEIDCDLSVVFFYLSGMFHDKILYEYLVLFIVFSK